MTACARQVRREWLEDGVRRFEVGCACGWTATTSDGWDALAEYYRHITGRSGDEQ